MSWNYRVGRQKTDQPNEYIYGIYEVFYDDNGKFEGSTEDAMAPFGTSIKELKADYIQMHKALNAPVFDWDNQCEIK